MSTGGRIVFLTHTGAPSGAELAFLRLAAALRRGDVPTAVVLTETGPLVDMLAEAEVPATVVASSFSTRAVTIGGSVTRLIGGGFRMLEAGWRAGAAIQAAGGSVVVAESTKALLMGAVASRRARVPLVWHVHDRITSEYFGWLAPIIRLIGLVFARGFIVNSEGTRATLWTAGKPCAISYPGVELRKVPPRGPQRPPHEARLVMTGRLTEWKGQDLVLQALAHASSSASLFFLGGTHFGEEDYARGLEDLAQRLGLASRVSFLGHVDDPLPVIAQADVAVHYSRVTEPFGQVVVEAMAAGCAVIAVDEGGPGEIITDGVDGVLVPPRDPEALADAIDLLVADQEFRARLAAAGQARARDFDIDSVAAVAVDLLRRVVGRV